MRGAAALGLLLLAALARAGEDLKRIDWKSMSPQQADELRRKNLEILRRNPQLVMQMFTPEQRATLEAIRQRALQATPEQIAARNQYIGELRAAWQPLSAQLRRQDSGGRAFQMQRLEHEGRARVYWTYFPAGGDRAKPLPVVLDFYDPKASVGAWVEIERMNAAADRFGFIAAYPRATDSDDAGFLAALLADLAKRHAVDARRVYATGRGEAGLLAARLGAALSGRIAALALADVRQAPAIPVPERPVPVLSFLLRGPSDDPRAIPPGVAWWVSADRCRPRPAKTLSGKGTIQMRFEPPPGAPGASVHLTWVLPTRARPSPMDVRAAMWDFFRRHPLP